MRYIITIIIISVIIACQSDNSGKIIQLDDFKSTINLSYKDGKEINVGDIFSRLAWLHMSNNILIAHDPYNPIKGIHIFQNKKLLTTIGTIGGAENEILRSGHISIDQKGKYLWISDYGRLAYTRYNIDSIIQNDSTYYGRKFSFKKVASYEFQAINDSSLLCMDRIPPYLFEIISENGEKRILDRRKIISVSENFPPNLSQPTFAYDQKTNCIYLAFRCFDALMKIDTSGNVIFIKKFFDGIGFNKAFDANNNNEIQTFSFLKLIDNKIFVLYSGLTAFHGGNVSQPVPNFPDKLMVFDLNGNPLTLIKFDTEIFDYVYNPKNKELIVYSLNSELYPLISYHLEL